MTAADLMRVLDRPSIERCLEAIDPVAVVERTLAAHADKETVLPAEGYLSWENSAGAYSRSLAMLGALPAAPTPLYGLKVVNAATSNPALGIERAGGVMMLFDPETARPRLLAEAGLVSALRTSAYTVLSVQRLGPEQVAAVSVLGCGTLARVHLRLLARYLPELATAHVYDVVPQRAHALADWARTELPGLDVRVANGPEECVGASRVLVTVTVSDTPYIDTGWFDGPGLVAHVSLDDVDRSVFESAQAVLVDDVELVVDNPRRILGSLVADGVVAPEPRQSGACIAGTLGDVVAGRLAAPRPTDGLVVSNPFGMAILDVALMGEVDRAAAEAGLGVHLDLVGGE